MDGLRLDLTTRHYLLLAIIVLLLSLTGWVVAWTINKRTKFSFPISAAMGAIIATLVLLFFLILAPM